MFRGWAPARPFPGQAASLLPGSPPITRTGACTGRRRRAFDQVMTAGQSPPDALGRATSDQRGLRSRARWPHAADRGPGRFKLELDGHRQPSRRAAVQVHVNLAGPCPEKLQRLQHGGDVPPLAVTADIAGELAAELQAPLLVIGDKADSQILIRPRGGRRTPPPSGPSPAADHPRPFHAERLVLRLHRARRPSSPELGGQRRRYARERGGDTIASNGE